MIEKLLIANRGEIACRIIRTARRMGVRTVAVYSDADRNALHVRQADETVHIGPSPAAESYLRGERIIAAAKETGAEAIHPGYGFLSENADFAAAVIEAGLVWVGPRPESIRAMGLKDRAKELMQAAGVPVTPGHLGEDQSADRLMAEAEKIGFPVLIKAVAGGGGKGMRRVDAAQQFVEMLGSCRREARAAFGNDQVLLERWITSPRHIEVQVFGDTHGNVVHLFERDCSLQRRHQKVIEEAPAPGMDEATRAQICAAAVRAAEAVDYVGAGTIEFIADASEGLRADRIFFMEMNTRLQVEHPVTEEITGVDLVEWQLRVASGEELPLRQEELSITGHAIEARLYAEDPARGFLPSTGRLERFQLSEYDARVETGYEQGDTVASHYDPMLAKLVVHAASREDAVERLADECAKALVWPVKTNNAFLSRTLLTDKFGAGGIDTGFLERHLDSLTRHHSPGEKTMQIGASEVLRRLDNPGIPRSEMRRMRFERGLRGFRLNANPLAAFPIAVDGEVARAAPTYAGYTAWHIEYVSEHGVLVSDDDGQVFHFDVPRTEAGGHASAHDGDILAPMPGKVIAVDVAEGQAVEAGQRLLVLEAMKMEHALTAPFAGTVAELAAREGAQVQVEALLARVEKVE